jgi:hypothetical protein
MSRKATIPRALREQVWIEKVGKKFQSKCKTTWCSNKMTVFDFQCGHDIPESKGGSTDIRNLVPICSRCNLSMSDDYTFTEWCSKSKVPSKWTGWFSHLFQQWNASDTTESGSELKQNPMSQKRKPRKLRGNRLEIHLSAQKKSTESITKSSGKK